MDRIKLTEVEPVKPFKFPDSLSVQFEAKSNDEYDASSTRLRIKYNHKIPFDPMTTLNIGIGASYKDSLKDKKNELELTQDDIDTGATKHDEIVDRGLLTLPEISLGIKHYFADDAGKTTGFFINPELMLGLAFVNTKEISTRPTGANDQSPPAGRSIESTLFFQAELNAGHDFSKLLSLQGKARFELLARDRGYEHKITGRVTLDWKFPLSDQTTFPLSLGPEFSFDAKVVTVGGYLSAGLNVSF